MLNSIKRRWIGAIGVASATAFILLSLSATAAAQPVPTTPTDWPVLQLANPAPGALLDSGDYIVSGMAYDPAATQGAGISRVDIFLGSRDEGGIFLGSAIPGEDIMPGVTPGSALGQSAFQMKVTLPSTPSGSQAIHAYAYSSLTGKTTELSMPVFVSIEPTATPSDSTMAKPDMQVVRVLPAAAGTGVDTFSLGNPSSGDVVLNGDYMVSGAAGSAIDRVQLFLDSRDTGGGTHLATVVPQNGVFSTVVTIPAGAAGGHTFTAYAHSSLTGQETVVTVPIFVGAAPTPTPRPG
jgi:hypothetical protein